MSDIKVNERDPYEFYRDHVAENLNDSTALSDLKQSPLHNYDSGREVAVPRVIPSDELADIADRTSHSLRGASDQQVEQAREFLRQRGVEPGRRRFYSYGK